MKNKLFKVMLGAAAVTSASLFADTAASTSSFRPYVSIGAGALKPGSRDKINYKWGMGGNVAVGVSYDAWRFELEGGYRQAKLKKWDDQEVNGCKFKTLSTMFNVYYDYSLTEECFVYVGVGLGAASVKYALDGNQAPFQLQANFKDEAGRIVFAWQAMAGIGYDINNNWTVTAGYRCFNTMKVKVSEYNGTETKKKSPFVHTLELGLRYSF